MMLCRVAAQVLYLDLRRLSFRNREFSITNNNCVKKLLYQSFNQIHPGQYRVLRFTRLKRPPSQRQALLDNIHMQLSVLSKELQEFYDNVNLIKKSLNDDQYQEQVLAPSFVRCNELSESIQHKFNKGKFGPGERLNKQTLQKDFKRILGIYVAQIQKHKRMKERELDEVRDSYRKTFSLTKAQQARAKAVIQDSEQDNNQTRIQLVEVNQDLLFQGQMIEQKTKQLMAINTQITTVLDIQNQIAGLINKQGDDLDIAQDNINLANSNVKDAQDNLKDAKQHHKSATRKKMIIVGIILVIVLAIFIPIGVKYL